jgi:hypothetical protein
LKNPVIVRRLGRKCFPALKVPSQCPLIRSVEVRLREGKPVGSEEGNSIRKWVDFVARRGFTMYDRNVI